MNWAYVEVAAALAQFSVTVFFIQQQYKFRERARLAEGKYEALAKLNGDVPRKRLPMLDEELMEATYLENKTLKEALAKVQQSEREWHETALQNEAGLRKAQSELEEARRYDIRKYGEDKVVRQIPVDEKVGSYVWSAGGMTGAFCNQCNARGPGQVWLMEHIRDTHLGVT